MRSRVKTLLHLVGRSVSCTEVWTPVTRSANGRVWWISQWCSEMTFLHEILSIFRAKSGWIDFKKDPRQIAEQNPKFLVF